MPEDESQDATRGRGVPKTLPEELTKAIQSESFRIFLEQEAERRIVTALRRLTIYATPLVVALAFFGWRAAGLYSDLEKAKEDVEESAQTVKAQATNVRVQSEAAEAARKAAEKSVADIDERARAAGESAGKVAAVKGQMEAISSSLLTTAQ